MSIPKEITQAAKQRVNSAKAELQRKKTLQATALGFPLDAEPSIERKLHRIMAVTDLPEEEAKRVALKSSDSLLEVSIKARNGAEKIQGKTIDFLGASAFLDLARAAVKTVARISFKNGSPQGTGFMVSDRLLLTNNHVIPSISAANEFIVEFDYELELSNRRKQPTIFELDPDTFFLTNSEDNLDFTLVAIGEKISGPCTLSEFGFCPLIATDDKHILGEYLNVIQHPNGDFKQIVIRENQIVTRLETVLHYMADTLPGSSGSPVFNDQFEVVALHHWGEPFRELELPDGTNIQKDVNEGIRISAIIKTLHQAIDDRGFDNRLLQEVLAQESRLPSTLWEESLDFQVNGNGKKRSIVKKNDFNVSTDGHHTDGHPKTSKQHDTTYQASKGDMLTIPLQITISINDSDFNLKYNSSDASASDDGDSRNSPEAIKIDRNYENRNGYDPDFLQDYQIELPDLSSDLLKDAAKRNDAGDGDNPYELKYQNFSLVMNADKRMAFFTATNIDGSTWVDIDRKSGQPRGGEASEIWYSDPRIPASAQSDQSLYSNQRPSRKFDRGHLVRRQDPTWGNNKSAVKANADTFHFTNCTPQYHGFNQKQEFWQGIEDYILKNTIKEKQRVTVFTGPVFDDDDITYRYTKVPKQFWKIIARVDNEELLVTALLASQHELIGEYPEAREGGFDDLGQVNIYQVSVSEIENFTGLSFGELKDFDTYPERESSKWTKVQNYDELKLWSKRKRGVAVKNK